MSEFTPNCRCKPATVKTYLDYTNTIEGKLTVDHEPPIRPEDHPEGTEWPGGVVIERSWRSENGKERADYVVLSFTEAEKVRDALNAFIWDHS